MTSEERDEGSLRLLAVLGDIDDRFVMEAACSEATGSAGKQADASKGDSETELAQEGDIQKGTATAKVQVDMPADVASDAMPEAEGCGVAPADMLAHSKPETEGPDDVSAGKAPRSAPVEKASVDVSPGKAKGKVLRFTPERVRVLAGVGIAACLLVAGAIVFARPEMLGLNNPGPSEPAMMRGAVSRARGVGGQNRPEGAAIALPLRGEGMSRGRAFTVGAASAVVEPLFGVLCVLAVTAMQPLLPWLLGFAAGAMLFVSVRELIPEACCADDRYLGTLSVLLGFTVMMILDIALG